MKNYCREWDEKRGSYKDIPYHNWASHGADAFEIIGQAWRLPYAEPEKPKPKFLHETTLDELWASSAGTGNRKRI